MTKQRRYKHRHLTWIGIPGRKDGNKLGLRKRNEILSSIVSSASPFRSKP